MHTELRVANSFVKYCVTFTMCMVLQLLIRVRALFVAQEDQPFTLAAQRIIILLSFVKFISQQMAYISQSSI